MSCTGAHNTRFSVLPQGEGIPNLASQVLAMNLGRLSGDWQAAWGHPLELAETFVAPRLYRGKYTDKHGERKQMLVNPLRRGARFTSPLRLRDYWRCCATCPTGSTARAVLAQ